MKKYMTAAAICGCLLIGSLYPKLLLDHHVKLIDKNGIESTVEGEYQENIPIKLEFGLLNFFRTLK